MHNTTKDWEYLAKNFNCISAEVITDKALLRLRIHILATEYLEKGAFCLIKVIREKEEINKEAKMVPNSEKEVKIKLVFYKEKNDAQALLLVAACLSTPPSTFMPGWLASFGSAVLVPGSSADLLASMFAVPMPRLSAPSSALPVPLLEMPLLHFHLLCLCLDCLLLRFCLLCLWLSSLLLHLCLLCLCLGRPLLCLRLLCLCLGCSLHCFRLICLRCTSRLHGLSCRYKCLFRKNKE